LVDSPTAVHAVADMQETAFRALLCAPGALGVDCRFQELPFHPSASVISVPELS
jgi:hypothetical protein